MTAIIGFDHCDYSIVVGAVGSGSGGGAEIVGLIWPLEDTAVDIGGRVIGALCVTNKFCDPGLEDGFHKAVDIVYTDGTNATILPTGTAVIAAAPGKVITTAFITAGGNLLEILHTGFMGNPPFITRYEHLQGFLVSVGDTVVQGQTVARSGNTGSASTGPHLHFALWLSPNIPLDPCANLPDIPGRIFHCVNPPPSCIQIVPQCGTCGSSGPAPDISSIVSLICSMFRAAGATPVQANLAVAIAAAESHLNPVVQDNVNSGANACACPCGECRNIDRGLFQINLKCHVCNLISAGIISNANDLYDPVKNIRAAIRISNGGQSFALWSTYTTGAYLPYLLRVGYTCP
jgi:murein DD-endopeptidase MepM/ murein hydrolase activator NlpD